MPSCDMCGKKVEFLNQAIVEGTMLSVCESCSEFGKIVKVEKPHIEESKKPQKIIPTSTTTMIDAIIEDWASKIKNAREKLGLTQEDLAQKIAEKESVIHNVESGHLEPSIKLAKKFEQFFRITLIEKIKEEHKTNIDLRSSNITIGDLLKMKGK